MRSLFILLLLLQTPYFVFAQDQNNEALAYHYYQQNDFNKAVVYLEKLYQQTKNDYHFDLYYNTLLKIKRYKEAENLANKLLKQSPNKPQYLVALGRVFQEEGKQKEANKIFTDAINNTAKTEDQFRILANEFYRFESFDMAIETFMVGRKLLANEKLFAYDLISIYRFKKDKVMLIQEYLNVISETPEILRQAQNVLANVFEDNSDYQLLQTALIKKIQKEPQVEAFTDMLIWQFMQQGTYEIALRQLIAQDKRTKSDAAAIFYAAQTFYANKNYPTTIKAYEYVLSKGADNDFYIQSKINLINTKYEMAIADKIDKAAIETLCKEYEEIINTFGKNPKTLFAIKRLANLQAYHLNQLQIAENTLEEGLAIKGLNANDIAQLKIELGDIYVLSKQPWEAILIYEQVTKAFEGQQIANEANFKATKLNFYMGDFKFAKSQADVLKASTSTLIANDALNLSLLISDNLQSKQDSLALLMYADAELLTFTHLHHDALNKLDSINIKYPNNSLADDILMAKAKIFIKNIEYQKSVDILKSLINEHQHSIWLDDALFLIADLFEKQLQQPEEAKRYFEKLVNDYPGSMLNAEARKRFRSLRGDNIGV